MRPSGLKATLQTASRCPAEGGLHGAPCTEVPQDHHAVVAARGQRVAVGAERHALELGVVAGERLPETSAGAGIPDDDGPVVAAGGHQPGVGADRHVLDLADVAGEGPGRPAARPQVPQLHRPALGAEGQEVAVAAQGALIGEAAAASKRPAGAAPGQVPHGHRPVEAGRRQAGAAGAERNARDVAVGHDRQLAERPASLDVPEEDGVPNTSRRNRHRRAGGQRAAVGAERDAPDPGAIGVVDGQVAQCPPAGRVPQDDLPVEAAGGQRPAVRAERQRLDHVLVRGDGRTQPNPPHGVPQQDPARLAARSQDPAVSAEGHAADRTARALQEHDRARVAGLQRRQQSAARLRGVVGAQRRQAQQQRVRHLPAGRGDRLGGELARGGQSQLPRRPSGSPGLPGRIGGAPARTRPPRRSAAPRGCAAATVAGGWSAGPPPARWPPGRDWRPGRHARAR